MISINTLLTSRAYPCSIPMPEGFTPASIEMFDKEIELIVKQYSLKGINVLTHCRGSCPVGAERLVLNVQAASVVPVSRRARGPSRWALSVRTTPC